MSGLEFEADAAIKAKTKAWTFEAKAKAWTFEAWAEAMKIWPRRASRPRPDLEAEQATGQWVKWVTILDGSHGSWVTVC